MCDCFLVSFQKDMPDRLNLHIILLFSMLSPAILLSLRLLGILKWDDPTPLGMFSPACLCVLPSSNTNDRPGKKRKNLIIQNLNEAVVVTDLEGRFLFLNPMAETLVSSMKKKPSTVRKTAKSTIFSGVRRDILTGWITTIRSRKRNCKAATPHRDIC